MSIRAPLTLEPFDEPALADASGVGTRINSFSRDDRGQIIPLVMFLGIAFFTSVVMIINTGKTVTGRIENQNAVDSAIISGATNMARGMNYVASNNVTQARIISVIIILRAWLPAAETAEKTLTVWKSIIIPAIQAAGNALMSNPFTAAIGAFLVALANVLRIYINAWEDPIVDIFKQAADLFTWFDKGIGVGLEPMGDNNDSGVAWTLLKGLTNLAKLFVWWTPLLAQWSCQMMYQRNLTKAGGLGLVAMLPLFPTLPVCQSGFLAFFEPVAKDAPGREESGWVDVMSKPVPFFVTFAVPLSLMPAWYLMWLEIRTKEMFGLSPPMPDPENDPRAQEIKDLGDQIKAKQAQLDPKKLEHAQIVRGEIPFHEERLSEAKKGKGGAGSDPGGFGDLTGGAQEGADQAGGINPEMPAGGTGDSDDAQAKIDAIQAQLDAANAEYTNPATSKPRKEQLKPGTLPSRQAELNAKKAERDAKKAERDAKKTQRDNIADTGSQAWKNADAAFDILDAQWKKLKDQVETLEDAVSALEDRRDDLQDDIEDLEDDLDDLQEDLDKKTNEMMGESAELGQDASPDFSDTNIDSNTEHRHDDDIHPWLLLGDDWPHSFTYLAIAGRQNSVPLGANDRPAGTWDVSLFKNKMPVGVTYAAARLFAAKYADAWTPNWTAKLVRVDLRTLPMSDQSSQGPQAVVTGKLPGKCGSGEQASGDSSNTSRTNGSGDSQGRAQAQDGWSEKLRPIIEFFSRH